MNFSKGLYHTFYHPRLLIIALLMNVIITFISVLGTYFGFTVYPSLEIGENQRIDINATFPFWMPFLDDIRYPYHFLQEQAYNDNWLMSLLATVLILIVKSYALAMYLGSMKGFLQGTDNTYSILKIGSYFFKRMLLFSAIELLFGGFFFLLEVVFLPIIIIGLVVLLFYSLTPYIIILEDITVFEAISKAPSIFRKNFKTLFFLALSCMFLTFLLTMLSVVHEKIAYYTLLLGYCFIGTVFIFAVMNCLHFSIHNTMLPSKKVRKSRYLYPALSVLVFLLPLLGACLASGQFLHIFALMKKLF
ncbi:hypothetical protein ACLM5H_25990 [Fredinandcohnia humi]